MSSNKSKAMYLKWIIDCARNHNKLDREPYILKIIHAIQSWFYKNSKDEYYENIRDINWNNPSHMCFSNVAKYMPDLPEELYVMDPSPPHIKHAIESYHIFNIPLYSQDVLRVRWETQKRKNKIINFLQTFIDTNIANIIADYHGGCCDCGFHNREIDIPKFTIAISYREIRDLVKTMVVFTEGDDLCLPGFRILSKELFITEFPLNRNNETIFRDDAILNDINDIFSSDILKSRIKIIDVAFKMDVIVSFSINGKFQIHGDDWLFIN